MVYTFYPKGVCSKRFDIDLQNGIISDICIERGCHGNLQGIARLLQGQPAQEVIARLRGIRCGDKQTSCPDQIALALMQAVQAEKEMDARNDG